MRVRLSRVKLAVIILGLYRCAGVVPVQGSVFGKSFRNGLCWPVAQKRLRNWHQLRNRTTGQIAKFPIFPAGSRNFREIGTRIRRGVFRVQVGGPESYFLGSSSPWTHFFRQISFWTWIAKVGEVCVVVERQRFIRVAVWYGKTYLSTHVTNRP